jgi:epoxyqueuosine reductase
VLPGAPIDPSLLTAAELSDRAADLGLEAGASGPEPGAEGPRFLRWLAEGRHAAMAWLERDPDRRLDARAVVAGARSVISVALPYAHGPREDADDDRPRGLVARYARGEDYHRVLLEKVKALAATLGDLEARPYVDTGPILEKPRAQRAGLGWSGKHTNLVSRRHGSWFFLGAIVTRRDVEPGPAEDDHCGTCTRCLDVCPTGAIRPDEPYRLDARLCISYLTIEHRGPIPRELRPAIGAWIFGCDLCLDVCPWNRFAQPVREARLLPRPALVNPVLTELLAWTQEDFSAALQHSPLKRTKRRGLLRNVAIALGNAGDRSAVPALALCLRQEAEPLVRGHAAWALGRLGGAAARAALEAARADDDPFVREEVEAALSS